MRSIGIVIFEGFQALDVYGPVELFGFDKDAFTISLVAERDGPLASVQGPSSLPDQIFASAPQYDLLLVPGGAGARTEVTNKTLLAFIAAQSRHAELTASVCTGATLLAAAGVLKGKAATTNKRAWKWATSYGADIAWRAHARWVEDGNIFTSSGVSAGMDMTLAIIAKLLGIERAEEGAIYAEYRWNKDPSDDPFAALYGL